MNRSNLRAGLSAAARIARRPPRWLILTLLVVGIELSYVFIITAGTFTNWPTWNTNYDLQAEGFRAGHLHLLVEPPAELLAKANPFDPANVRLWFWDASLHGQHLYLYWGPLPALAIAAIKTVFRMAVTVGDQYPLFVFYTIYLISGALILERMARRLFDGLPLWLVAASIAVFAYANPTPFMIGTPGIYEAAIAAGQAFLLLGAVFAFDALWKEPAGRGARRALFLAGISWALGLGCRVSIGPPAALIGLVTVLLIHRSTPPRQAWLDRTRDALRMGTPIAAAALGLLAYNKARFGAWLDFGMNSQLSTMRFRTSAAYVLPNVYSYLLRPLSWSCKFPFFGILPGDRGFPHWLRLPEGYWTPEPLAGMLAVAPWTWLTPVAAFFAGTLAWRSWHDRGALRRPDPGPRTALWCVATFIILGTAPGLPTVGQFIATMRYSADVMSGILLFAIWGAWSLYWHFRDRPWPRRLVGAVILVLAISTVVLGFLLGLQGYDGMFQRINPSLFGRLVRTFSLCK